VRTGNIPDIAGDGGRESKEPAKRSAGPVKALALPRQKKDDGAEARRYGRKVKTPRREKVWG